MTNVFPLPSESLSFKNIQKLRSMRTMSPSLHHHYLAVQFCNLRTLPHRCGNSRNLAEPPKKKDFASQSNIKYIKEFQAMTTKELDKVMWMSDVLLDVVDACGYMLIHAGLSEESWFASARWWLPFSLLKPSATDPLVVNFTKGGHWFAGQSLVHPSSTQHCVAEAEACVFHSSDQ